MVERDLAKVDVAGPTPVSRFFVILYKIRKYIQLPERKGAVTCSFFESGT